MTTKTNLKRIREILTPNNTDEFDNNISEDDESNSDPNYLSETESDDISTDECISKEDESSDSNIDDDGIYIDTNAQPETIKKGGLLWSTHKSTTSEG